MTGRARGAGVLAIAVLAGAGGGSSAAAAQRPHIVGGTSATQAYPFMASVTVSYPAGVSASCGGTLVAARYVVTAGHCVASDATLGGDPSRVDVVIGASNLLTDTTAERIAGATVLRNPAFSTGGLGATGAPRNDVAVLRLPTPSGKVPARLPRTGDAALWEPGTTGIALGYGLTRADDDSSAQPQLQQVDLPIAADDACRQAYGSAYDGSDLCAGGVPGKDTCQGDSGGPLLVADATGPVLAGVTSYGDQCGRTYGVYAEAGGTVNAFLRSVIPQVEVDPPAGALLAGRDATFTAAASDPDGNGAFGGYDALAWDLDGDGAYDDASGTSATSRLAAGANAVSVLAVDRAGNRETRTIAVSATRLAARLTVSGKRSMRVRSSRFAVTVKPNQPGTVTATVKRGSSTLGRGVKLRVTSTKARRLTLRLSAAAAKRLRRDGRRKVVVRATLAPSAGGAATTARRTLSLTARR